MQSNILFDNIYVGHSIEDAKKLAAETFHVKHPVEKALAEADKPKKEDKPKSPEDLKFLDDPIFYIREKLDLFIAIAETDPISAVKFVPEIAAGIGGLVILSLVLLVTLISAFFSSSAPAPAPKKAEAKVEAKDEAAEATTTGAEKAKSEVTKRTTRSQS